MNHRHLLPDEFDLLLDDEVGFGVAPLREHVRECADCLAKLEDARVVSDALEELPHFAPSFAFSSRVLARVPVFVPWHVAARDSALRYLPHSRGWRIAAAGVAAVVGATLSVASVWVATHGDLLALATGVAGDHLRSAATASLRDGLASFFGPDVFSTLQGNGIGSLTVVVAGFVIAAAASALGLRSIAAASRRRG